jgi:hypothetical protein
MNLPSSHQRIEQLALAAGWSASAHIQPSAHALRRDEYRTAGSSFGILGLTNADRANFCYRNLAHGFSPSVKDNDR